jgi:LEA14-like dessication related protein
MHMQAYIIKPLSLAGLILSLSGCSLWPTSSYRDPHIHLLKVQVVKAKLVQQDFNLLFKVENENDSRILVRGLRYKIMLNDVMLADDRSSQWFFVPAHGQKTFTVPVRTNLWKHLKPISRMLKKPEQTIRYRLEGKLKTGLLFRDTVVVGRSGEITPGALIEDH